MAIVKKGDARMVGLVTLGVIAAGFVMYQFRDVGLISQARAGYDV